MHCASQGTHVDLHRKHPFSASGQWTLLNPISNCWSQNSNEILYLLNCLIFLEYALRCLTVLIHTPDRKYLWFSWKGTKYQFMVLLFGLSTVLTQTFTKIIWPVMKKLREQGLHLVIYLDDILLMANSPWNYDTTLTFWSIHGCR